jgi:hypothetical protein
MADVNQLATAIREELVAAGLVRRPDTVEDLPPLIIEPRGGAPAPGDRDAPEDHPDLVVTLTFSGDISELPRDTYRRRSVFDVRYRSKGTAGLQRAHALDAAIRGHLVNRNDFGLGWTMGTDHPVFILSSQMFAGLGRIGSTAEGFDELAKYLFEVHA